MGKLRRRSRRSQREEPDLIVNLQKRHQAKMSSAQTEESTSPHKTDTEQVTQHSRVARLKAQQQAQETGIAHQRMRRFLNWGILTAAILIVVVYLILFFL